MVYLNVTIVYNHYYKDFYTKNIKDYNRIKIIRRKIIRIKVIRL